MKFERLEEINEELAQELFDTKIAAVKRSSSVEDDDNVVDAILLNLESPLTGELLARLDGYALELPSTWFEFVSAPYGEDEEKCVELARNALSE